MTFELLGNPVVQACSVSESHERFVICVAAQCVLHLLRDLYYSVVANGFVAHQNVPQ